MALDTDEVLLRIPTTEAEPARRLGLRFVGASPAARLAPERPTRAIHNYFHGRDPAAWVSHVPTYRAVRVEGVYPGIDIVWRSDREHGEQLEFDIEVAPDTPTDSIRLRVEGADDLVETPDGGIRIVAGSRSFLVHPPAAFQVSANRSLPLDACLHLVDGRTIAFDLRDVDPSLPLVIDPVIEYSTYLGGSDVDAGFRVAAGLDGSAVVVGQTDSMDFPTWLPLDGTLGGPNDAFVTRFDASGNVVYTRPTSAATRWRSPCRYTSTPPETPTSSA